MDCTEFVAEATVDMPNWIRETDSAATHLLLKGKSSKRQVFYVYWMFLQFFQDELALKRPPPLKKMGNIPEYFLPVRKNEAEELNLIPYKS